MNESFEAATVKNIARPCLAGTEDQVLQLVHCTFHIECFL